MELLAGCGSIDLIDGAEWIRGCGALGASDLYPIREAAEGGDAYRGRCVVLNT